MSNAKTLNAPALFWSAIGVTALLSLALRFDGATPDISWLISMCERMIDGEIAYVDIFETTPPTAALLYMPGALLSRVTSLSAEAVIYIFAYLAAFLTLALSARILPLKIDTIDANHWQVLFPAAFFLLILSNDGFAQREYFAAAFVLPMIAVFITQAQTKSWPGFQMRLWAAVLAGLSVAIKPPVFAAPGLLLGLYYLIATRNFRGLYSSGLLAGGAVGVAITAISLVAFPAYLDGVTTLMRDVYVPARAPFNHMLNAAFMGFAAASVGALALCAEKRPPTAVVLVFIAAAAYGALYALQGKFFAYHLLPASLFAFIGFWVLAARRLSSGALDRSRKIPFITIYATIACAISATMFLGFDDKRPRIHDLRWADDLEKPTAMAISPYISVGFPLARQIDAVWIDRIHSQWVSNYTRIALHRHNDQTSAFANRMRDYHQRDIERTRALIREQRPELIIQAVTQGVAWLNTEILESDPALLDDYFVIAEEGVFRIWRRRDAIGAN